MLWGYEYGLHALSRDGLVAEPRRGNMSGSDLSSSASSECSPTKGDSGVDVRDVDEVDSLRSEFPHSLKVLEPNCNIRFLQTVIRDK